MSVFKSRPLSGLALFALACFAAMPAAAASESAASKSTAPKQAVTSVERNAGDSASSSGVRNPEIPPEMGWGRLTDSDWGPATVRPAAKENQDFADFYYIPDQVRVEAEPVNTRAIYWIGATGAVLAAGVAAWFIFSEEPKSQTSVVLIP
jgi:hypothetical protein